MIRKIILGVLLMLFIIGTASAANTIYLDPNPAYIPACGSINVEVRMDADDPIDTWSTKIQFDDTCVNITDVEFTGSIAPENASWGHHGNLIYLGGTELTSQTGDKLLAVLTVECLGVDCNSGGCECDLELVGVVDEEQLVAGPPDGNPPYGTIYDSTWEDGTAQCVLCGNVNLDDKVSSADFFLLRTYVLNAPVTVYPWAANVNGDAGITSADYFLLRTYILNAPVTLNCDCSG